MTFTEHEAERLLRSRRKALDGETQRRTLGAARDAVRELSEIDAALGRITDGTYGVCEICGGAIGRDRLRALPEIRRCLSCA